MIKMFRIDTLLSFVDSLPLRKARVKGLGKESTVTAVYPYGLTANPPSGSTAFSWPLLGQESNRAAIIDNPQLRDKSLSPGEVILSNFLIGSKIKFNADGSIEISSEGDLNINVKGDLNITVDGDIALTATNIIIEGNLTNNGTNIGSTHQHPQGTDSDGDTQQDTGTPI